MRRPSVFRPRLPRRRRAARPRVAEQDPSSPPRGLRRGAYLLPSLFTTGNILLGFYAIVLAMRGRVDDAALALVIAAVLDGLDGRIARLTHTESEFGREFDSLADVLTFGAAPAWMAYFWGLENYGRPGWLVPLFFLLCTAIRLARFNVQTKNVDSRYFVGLPSPAGAGALAAFFFIAPRRDTWEPWIDQTILEATLFFALVGVGLLMVSTFRYTSFKKIDLRRRFSYRAALLFTTGILILAYHPPAFFLSAALVYTLSGPIFWLWSRFKTRETTQERDP